MPHMVLQAEEEAEFFVLPSPNEILSESEKLGLNVKITKENSKILRTKFEDLAKTDRLQATYAMGRVFAVAGFSFSNLNNAVILAIAGKIFSGTKALKLPPAVNDEIVAQYQKMLKKPKWEREELMISFTAARSSLMFLLKDSNKVLPEERTELEALATCIEMGIWYQSIYLALENLPAEKISAFYELYMDEDVVNYFDKMLKHSMKKFPDSQFLKGLLDVNQACSRIMEDDKLDAAELKNLKPLVQKVVQ